MIFLTIFLALAVIFSLGVVSAEANITDSSAVGLTGDLSEISASDVSNMGNDKSELSVSDVNVVKSENANESSRLSCCNGGDNLIVGQSSSVEVFAAGSAAASAVKLEDTVKSGDVVKYYRGSAKYTATFTDMKGTALANTDVKITVNGAVKTVKTNSNGVASLAVNLKPGTYKIVATNPKTSYKLTTTFMILSTISASDVTKVYTDSRKFTAKFLKSDGKALAKKKVKFRINGKTYSAKTNSNGVASLSMINLKKGTYKIISYNTDGLTKTNKVKVVSSTTSKLTSSSYVFLKKNTKKIKVNLKNGLGYAPGAGKIIKITINGKTYSSKTNSNGDAFLTLPNLNVGVYTFKCKFAGNAFYKASSTSNKVTIILTDKISVSNVLAGATNLKNHYAANSKFPKTVVAGGITFTIPEFLYVMSQATYQIGHSNKADITWIPGVKSPESSFGDISGTHKLTESKYLTVANNVAKYIFENKQAPNYASSALGKISYNQLVDSFSRVLAYYKANSQMPNYVEIKEITSDPTSTGKTISIKNILTGATNLKNYYSSNGKLPNTVTAGGITFTTPAFLYLMSQAIYQIGNSNNADIDYITSVSAPESPTGDSINSKQLTESNYIKVANNVAGYIRENKQAPNFASSSLGKIIYGELVDSFSRVLAYYNANNQLPAYVVISYGSTDDVTPSGTAGSGLNQKNTIKDVSAYLRATSNCQVGNSAIKSIVNSVTSGLTSDLAKAKAIFNYVRDRVSYSYYYDTKYGAVGTLNAKTGNCVDQAHLLISMYRTAGIAARYVHGSCRFSDGTYGHVWTQVLVNGYWYVGDPISARNSLGTINNWNTNTFSLYSTYSSLPF
ncbi:pseudomurein-binding repeat-containing protein [Methanobrevibacter sp.]|uniref:pseudomurein-binding repeat-containing protein n=1 Tax=Methanobrevibacter sp. TaxID=66852 RepID=UPI00388F4946